MSALSGLRVVELAGLAPVPFCGMVLADFGASVTRVDRVSRDSDLVRALDQPFQVAAEASPVRFGRHKRSLALDLKRAEGRGVLRRLAAAADVLIEPFRPGVMEKLGLGPTELCAANPRLVYARLSGYGQTGPRAALAGHDINYLAASGVLSSLGRSGSPPSPPVNLLADFAGGGLSCAFGILAALLERQASGKGQVVDAGMSGGAAYVSSFLWATGGDAVLWGGGGRGRNLLDSGFPLYNVYATAEEGGFVAVGALEPQFQAAFFQRIGGDCEPDSILGDWEAGKAKLAERFRQKTRGEWEALFAGSDACVSPVLSAAEAAAAAPGNFSAGFPLPSPLLSRSPAFIGDAEEVAVGEHSREVLREIGYSRDQIEHLLKEDVISVTVAKAKL